MLGVPLPLRLSASGRLLGRVPRTCMTRFKHPAKHVHMFGQNETAGIVCLFQVPRDFNGDAYVPIGGPIANTEIHILNENQPPCAIDQARELYSAGAGAGRGYANRQELTAENFVM